ncbi:MAG: tetratricopeptide repeat protein [Gammaproteobacteria bacterium]|nr:tetratricopeptide repeat protein [Gammaproteobacteria bacterium]
MSATSHKTVFMWLGVAAVIVLLAAAAFYLTDRGGPLIPQVDLSTMEPQVAGRIREYRAAVASDPDSAKAWARLAQVFHAHDLFTQAIEAYDKAMQLAPGDWRWPYLAALATAKSDPQAALPLFRHAIELKPTGAAIHINFGDILIRLGEQGGAEQAYQQALSADPESSHALYGLAQLALLSGDAEQAVTLLQRAKKLSPRHGEIYGLLAQAYQRLGNDDAARRESLLAKAWPDTTRAPDPVAQAMESLAVSAQSIALRGVSLAKRGEFAEAEKAFRAALESNPGSARYYANLGGALAGQGRADEALAAYVKGLQIDSSDVDLLNNAGFTYLQLGRFDEAEQHLRKALEIDPGFAPAVGNLGMIAEQRQESAQAIDYFEKALQLNPGLLFARNALAAQLARSGDPAAAIGQWRAVLEINPNELSAIYGIAMTQSGQGEHAEAIASLRRGLEIAPNSSRLVAALAWELATSPDDELRNGAEAMQLAQRVYRAYPKQPQMIDIMAAALAETGDFENAVKLMQRIAAGDNAGPLAMRLKAYRQEKPWRQLRTAAVKVPVEAPEQ